MKKRKLVRVYVQDGKWMREYFNPNTKSLERHESRSQLNLNLMRTHAPLPPKFSPERTQGDATFVL